MAENGRYANRETVLMFPYRPAGRLREADESDTARPAPAGDYKALDGD